MGKHMLYPENVLSRQTRKNSAVPSRIARLLPVWTLVLFTALVCRTAGQSTNGVLREVYLNLAGSSLVALTNAPVFPSSSSLDSVEPAFEAPPNWGQSYGVKMSALLTAPATGEYVFWIASDDQGVLFLSTDELPAHKRQIAWVNGWTGSRQYYVETNQQSAPISLTNGQRYYIEALMKQGSGGDNLAVAWQKPGDAVVQSGGAPIPGGYLIPYGLTSPVITQQPANATGVEGGSVTFSVKLQRTLGVTYQWIRNGTNVPGANKASLTLAGLRLSDSNSVFRCFMANAYGSTNSATATLSVVPDTTRPTMLSVAYLGNNQILSVLFSEPLDAVSASQAENYALSLGASVLGARLSDDLRTVILTTTPLMDRTNYSLTVNNVYDLAATPNVIALNSRITFNLLFTPLDITRITGSAEALGPSSRTTPLVITEIMYHPRWRADLRNLEFIELYNSQEWQEDISGYRISGEVDYTFPTNTIIGPKSFVVLAASPADMQAVYGITNARAYAKALNNAGGAIRLRNRQNAILLEANYNGGPPYPVQADGAGHSLVLARPSWGERHPQAWSASERIGGSPGSNEVLTANPQRAVLINELLANTSLPDADYVELFNYSAAAASLAGCYLTDDPATNKFRFPTNAVIPARGFYTLTAAELGFALSSEGETIYLLNTNATRVIDAVRFGAQAGNVAYGRYPDAAPAFRELSWPTPGTNNPPCLVRDVVINEIMFDPISGDPLDEYVELFNRGTNRVNLSGWRLRGGISFNFPAGASIAPGGYLVVAHDAARLMANYPNLNAANTLGDFSGNLRNSGDTVRLLMAQETIITNTLGARLTNQLHVAIGEVTYSSEGRWGLYAGGGGSSLELIDPRTDHSLAPNWAPSDETGKSDWVTIEHTGVLDNGVDSANALHLVMLGGGECLVDNVEVIPAGGTNMVGKSNFETGSQGWAFQGTHELTGVDATGGYGDNGKCLHVRASDDGDTGANRIRCNFASALQSGTTATLRMKVRWLAGWPEILMRLRGGYLEATGNILTARNLGTPGLPNSVARANSAPAIVSVTHSPVLPNAQPVTVSARISDPDGLSSVTLYYRIDPATNYTSVAMSYKGAGYYAANIPIQSGGALAAFYVSAKDNHAVQATATFPDDAPSRECLVRWGEPTPSGNLGAYHYWITQTTIDKWSTREKLSNDPLDGTFVYNGRVFYNVGGLYSGSPWHAPGWSSPVGNPCDYELVFPKDDPFLGTDQVKLLMTGNGGGESTAQTESHAYWIASELGMPFNYTRHIHLYVNGMLRNNGSPVFVDSQQPNGEFMDEWFPNNPDGDLYKMVFWYEFDDAGLGFAVATGVSLGNFTTTGGVKKTARYRWNWSKRAAVDSANNFSQLFALIDAVNTSLTGDAYTATIESLIDVDEWARLLMLEKLAGNWDSYGNGGGQNMYGCKPGGDRWRLLIWDIDFAFGGTAGAVDMFNMTDAPLAKIFNHPPFRRAYYQAMLEAVNGPLLSTRSNPILDSRYAALAANGASISSPQGIKDYIAQRRAMMLSYTTNVVSSFGITSNSGGDFSTNRNLIQLTGTAPLEVKTITLNGAPCTVTWTSITNWTLRTALQPGTNVITLQGVDSSGSVVSSGTTTININFTGIIERPEEKLVINEIMYNPVAPGASFVEVYNTSASNAFDLSGYRLDGVDFTFDRGTIIEPQKYLVLAKDKLAFASAYGSSIPVAGEFNGNLSHQGETLTLMVPGPTPAQYAVIDRVAYASVAPWPMEPNGSGPSLQLLDPLQDNCRVANWRAASTNSTAPPPTWRYVTASGTASSSSLYIYLQSAGDVYIDDVKIVAGSVPEAGANVLSNGDFESNFPGPWVVSANHAGSAVSSVVKHSGNYSLHVVASEAGNTRGTSIYQDMVPNLVSGQPYTLSFWYLPSTNGGPLTFRLSGYGISTSVNIGSGFPTNAPLYTPGAANSVLTNLPAFPLVWLNEIQPTNINGIADASGERDPWVELFNSGTNDITLTNYFLSSDFASLTNWAFPSNAVIRAGEFLVVWLDAQPAQTTATEFHANFRPDVLSGNLALSRSVNGQPMLLDYLNYSVALPGESYGSFPNGDPFARRPFFFTTPNASNNAAAAPVSVFINEWMPDNTWTLADPADGQFEDWFELYNSSINYADLTGYYLTDSLTNQFQYAIPAGYVIPPGGHLLVWADGESSQNSATNTDLHVDFKLGKTGEAIGLFAPDGSAIDTVTFGAQTADISEGRYPDANSLIYFMSNSTPRAPNLLSLPNLPPVIAPIAPQVVTENNRVTFTVTALDINYPPQNLTYSLGANAPAGAQIDPISGYFTWQAGAVSRPTTNFVTITVTDDGDPVESANATAAVIVIPTTRVDSIRRFRDWVMISWTVFPGKVYQVQYTEELPPNTWINFGQPTSAASGSLTITDSKNAVHQRFYRVVQLN